MPKTIYDYAEEYHRLVPATEWRQDPILDRWVIIARDRARRPIHTATVESQPPKKIDCPFCAGSEKATPDPVATYGNAEDWAVRIVPNKFPAVNADQGLHQVIVECPHHEPSLTGLPDANVNQVVRAYRDRILSLDEEPFVYGIIFKNFGADAGASLEHSHSQFIALPIVPPDVLEELRGALRYYQREEACVYCNLIEQSRPDRVILETEHHLAMCPFASRFPFEIWVLPKQHVSHFERIDEEQSKDLSRS